MLLEQLYIDEAKGGIVPSLDIDVDPLDQWEIERKKMKTDRKNQDINLEDKDHERKNQDINLEDKDRESGSTRKPVTGDRILTWMGMSPYSWGELAFYGGPCIEKWWEERKQRKAKEREEKAGTNGRRKRKSTNNNVHFYDYGGMASIGALAMHTGVVLNRQWQERKDQKAERKRAEKEAEKLRCVDGAGEGTRESHPQQHGNRSLLDKFARRVKTTVTKLSKKIKLKMQK